MADQRAERIDRESIALALQQAWNDFTSDTGCIPDCFTIYGPSTTRVVADFSVGTFAEMVAGWIGMGRQVQPIYDEGYEHGSAAATKHCYEAVVDADSLEDAKHKIGLWLPRK